MIIFQTRDIDINTFVIFTERARNDDVRKRFLYLANVVVQICCLHPTGFKLHTEQSKQNGLSLNVETGFAEII